MNGIKNLLIFAAGAVVGGIVTWRIAKKTYEKIIADETEAAKKSAQDEIDIYKTQLEDKIDNYVKETSNNSSEETENSDDENDEEEEVEEPEEEPEEEDEDEDYYAEPRYRYDSYLNELEYFKGKGRTDEIGHINVPYIINEADVGDKMDYDLIHLTFYADHILTDDANLPIKDIDEIVGPEALKCFLNEFVNIVYVRNERLGCDFEICRDLRRYADCRDQDKWRNDELNDRSTD